MVLAKPKTRSLLFNRPADCTKYGYDAVGQRAKMREPDGGRFTYWYDGVGQITRLLNPFQENTTFTYDVSGRRTMQKLANRVQASYTYDTADRLTTLANVRADGTYVSRYEYAYDNTINKTRVIEANDDRVTWSYDRTYQLTRERRSGANAYDTTYTYNASQNRRLMIDSGARTTYICDVANQLNWLQDNIGRTTFSYDANGNQTLQIIPALTRTTNVWDGENRLTQVQRSASDRSTYTYRTDNLRTASQEPGSTSNFVWDGQIYLLETGAAGATQATYSNEPTSYGNLLSQSRLATSSFYHADSPGSVTNLTNIAAAGTDSYLYRAFGTNVVASETTVNPFRFTGSYGYYFGNIDYYVRARWYSAIQSTWKSQDPLVLLNIIEMYKYSNNNPVNSIDPSGLLDELGIDCSKPKIFTKGCGAYSDDRLCEFALLINRENKDFHGFPICCDGRQIPCVTPKYRERYKRFPGLIHCVNHHERTHFPSLEPCPACGLCWPKIKREIPPQLDECNAYKEHFVCLFLKRGEECCVPSIFSRLECLGIYENELRRIINRCKDECGANDRVCKAMELLLHVVSPCK